MSLKSMSATRHSNALISTRSDIDSVYSSNFSESNQYDTYQESTNHDGDTDTDTDSDNDDISHSLSHISQRSTSSYQKSLLSRSSKTSRDVNPFLLPLGALPPSDSGQNMYPPLAYFMGQDPRIYDEHLRHQTIPPGPPARVRKKHESRVLFSDEHSIITDSSVTSASNTEATNTPTQLSDAEIERPARPTRRPNIPQPRAKSTKPMQAITAPKGQAILARSNSVPSAAGRAQSIRRRRPNESPKPSATRVRSKSAQKEDKQEDVPEENDLLGRISAAIPDLHLLLTKYKDANGELSLKDQLRRKIEAQQTEMVKSKEDTIQALMGQLEDTAREHADGVSKLKAIIEEMGGRQVEMQRQLTEAEERAARAELRSKSLEESERRLSDRNDQLIIEKAMGLAKQRSQLIEEYNSKGRELRVFLEKEKQNVEQQMEQEKTKHESAMEQQKMKHELAIEQQKTKHETETDQQRTVIIEKAKKEKGEIEKKLADLEKRVEELGASEEGIRQKVVNEWVTEKENLKKLHQEELEELREHHRQYCHDQMRGFVSLQESLNKALVTENESLKQLLGSDALVLSSLSPRSVTIEDVPE